MSCGRTQILTVCIYGMAACRFRASGATASGVSLAFLTTAITSNGLQNERAVS